MRVVAIANNKGGVGKTTTALCLAAGLREKKKKVLLIDLDEQENLRYACGLKEDDINGSSLLDVIYGKTNVNSCLFQIYDDIADFDLLVGGGDLNDIESESRAKEDILLKVLKQLNVEYDYIVLDTPPAINKITKAALTAADDLIVPIQAAPFSRQGLHKLFKAVNTVNPKINKVGLLLIGVKENTNIGREYTDLFQKEAQENYNTRLLKTIIHNSVAIPEAQTMKKTIFQYAANSTVANDYMNLTNEYLKGIKKNA